MYSQTVGSGSIKPYRISQIEIYLKDLPAHVSKTYLIIDLNTKRSRKYVIDLYETLNTILVKKEKAVRLSRNYFRFR